MEILAAVRVALQQGGYLKPPRVAVHPSVGAAASQLAAIVTKLGGELMPSLGALEDKEKSKVQIVKDERRDPKAGSHRVNSEKPHWC